MMDGRADGQADGRQYFIGRCSTNVEHPKMFFMLHNSFFITSKSKIKILQYQGSYQHRNSKHISVIIIKPCNLIYESIVNKNKQV